MYQSLCDTKGFLEPTAIVHNLFYDPRRALIAQYWSLPQELSSTRSSRYGGVSGRPSSSRRS